MLASAPNSGATDNTNPVLCGGGVCEGGCMCGYLCLYVYCMICVAAPPHTNIYFPFLSQPLSLLTLPHTLLTLPPTLLTPTQPTTPTPTWPRIRHPTPL